MADINILNEVCRQLFEATDPGVRRRAEDAFSELLESPDCLEKCFLLFEQGIIPYGPMAACNILLKIVSKKIGLNNEQRIQLLQYLLKYAVERVGVLPNFAINSICQLYGRLTKISWLDGVNDTFPFQDPIEKVIELFKEENERAIIAMKLVMALIDDMNIMAGLDGVGKQRRIAISFRDRYLCDIYMSTIDNLKNSATKNLTELRTLYMDTCLSLGISCMNFDFVGSFVDETIDESYNIQLPASWRTHLHDKNPVKLFFEIYHKMPIKSVGDIFRNITLLAAIRRTLFDSIDRKKFLTELLVGFRSVLMNPGKLDESDNFHEFCRLLSRVKSNFQLLELVAISEFNEVISMITEFTLKGFQVAEAFSQNSVYYLMGFWHRMASAVRTSSADKTEIIISCFPKVTAAFIQSRMSICSAVVRDGIDDPLDESHSIKQVMDYFSLICRIQYPETFQQLSKEFDSNIQIISSSVGIRPEEIKVAQKRLIWLVLMIGSAIEGKTASMYVSDHELMDGELASRVLKLMTFNDDNLTPAINDPDAVHLELALIFFLDHLRKMYLSETKDGKIFDKLKEIIGVEDGRQLLTIFARKIITNLKFWCGNEDICHGSLKLLNDLTVGMIPSRRLLAIDDMQLLLRNHTSQHFVFLSPTPNLKLMKARTIFYEALMRLMAIELDEDLSKFQEFLAPLSNNLNEISGAFDNLLAVNPDQLKLAVIGLARDITGLAMSCTKNNIFALLLNWLMPDAFNLFLRSVELWYESAELTTPIIRLMSELAQNRQSRMAFEMKSCTSVVLFREISKILCAYGNRLLSLPSLQDESTVYKLRLKNYGICFGVLRNVLSGAYLPFGVFWLYGDGCLTDALDVIFRMFIVLKNDHPQFMLYPKINQNILYLLQAVMKDNISYITKVDPNILQAIVHTCHDGIISLEPSTVTSSCAIIEAILDYLYLRTSRAPNAPPPPFHEPEGDVIYTLLYDKHPELMCQFIDTIMNMILFGDVLSNYSIGRVLMGLMFIYYEYFKLWKHQFMERQSSEMRKQLEEAFTSLTTGVKYSISSRNKDDFTMNLNSFKSDVAQILRGTKIAEENNPDMDGNSFGAQMFVYNYA